MSFRKKVKAAQCLVDNGVAHKDAADAIAAIKQPSQIIPVLKNAKGIDKDEIETIAQAIGYILFDIELY